MKGETLMTTEIDWKARAEAAEAREAALREALQRGEDNRCECDSSDEAWGRKCGACSRVATYLSTPSPRAAQLLAAQRVAEAYDAYERRGGQDLFVALAVELVSWRKAGQ